MAKETWQSYLKSERQKDKQMEASKNRSKQVANTKSFWGKQSFGAASEVKHIKV